MTSHESFCTKATFVVLAWKAIFALIVFCFFENKILWICFVENNFALIHVRKAYKSYQQSNLFYKYLTLLILKLWKAQKRSNNNWWKNIIWWKQHHLIDSHNFSSLIFFLVDEFMIHQLRKMTALLMLWKATDLKVLMAEKVLMSDIDVQQKSAHLFKSAHQFCSSPEKVLIWWC